MQAGKEKAVEGKEKAEELAEDAKQKAVGTSQVAIEKYGEWTEVGKKKAHEAKEAAEEVLEEGKEKASELAEAGKEKAGELLEKVCFSLCNLSNFELTNIYRERKQLTKLSSRERYSAPELRELLMKSQSALQRRSIHRLLLLSHSRIPPTPSQARASKSLLPKSLRSSLRTPRRRKACPQCKVAR